MTISPQERQYILAQVNRLASDQLAQLWDKAARLSNADFAGFVTQAFPELVDPYAAMAADLATTWYDETPSTTDYKATPGPLPITEQLTQSAVWALGGNGIEALSRMQNTAQRAISDTARNTTVQNAYLEPRSTWARHASANACAFCVLMATRGNVYASKQSAEAVVGRGKAVSTNFNADGPRKAGGQAKGVKLRGAQKLGDKYHDNCHCVAIEVRPGGKYEPPPYVDEWQKVYKDAFNAVPNGMAYDQENSVLKAVLSNMRTELGSH